MVTAYFIRNISDLKKIPSDAGRVYIGSEYCIRAWPMRFNTLLGEAKKRFPVTLITPPLLESELNRFDTIKNIFLAHAEAKDEIIINDWGVLDSVCESGGSKVGCGVGRFFSYQKRGTQTLGGAVNANDLRAIPILEKATIRFLKQRGVSRIEIDAPRYGAFMPECPDIALSVYAPFAMTSYTINCPHTFDGTTWRRACRRNCLASALTYRGGDAEEEFFQHGRIYLTGARRIDNPCIDRIVNMAWQQKS